MKSSRAARFRIEVLLAAGSALAGALFVLRRDWIEALLPIDPDAHSGSLELLLVAVCVAATITFAAMARREWRRLEAAPDAL